MTWREDLRRVTFNGRDFVGGSFRGVPFFVESAEQSGGRRTVSHEFPFRDDPFVEDLGRKARTYRFEAYVIGDDYLTQKESLITALEAENPGELIHPYKATLLRAICDSYGESDAKTDGGIAKFTLSFLETPLQAPVPTEMVDGPAQVDAGADAAASASDAELVEQYTADGLPSWAFASAQAAITKASAALLAKLAPIITNTQQLATLTGELEILTAEATTLARTPADVVSAFREAVQALTDTASSAPGDLMDALLDAYDVDLGEPVVATTATRSRELANQTALIAAIRRVFAVEAARLAPTVTYTTIDDAIAARDRIKAILDEQAALADDTAYPAIVDLRSKVLQAVPGDQAFARVITVTRRVPVPSVVLTYQIYGSVENELDLVARNDVKHPGFVSGDLEVLSDD